MNRKLLKTIVKKKDGDINKKIEQRIKYLWTYYYCVAVESQLRALAESEKWGTDNWEELCKAPETRKKVLTILQEQGKKSGLKGNEIIADVWICSELWLDSVKNDIFFIKKKIVSIWKLIYCYYYFYHQ